MPLADPSKAQWLCCPSQSRFIATDIVTLEVRRAVAFFTSSHEPTGLRQQLPNMHWWKIVK